ncbi:hypothetical protein OESDEN_15990, partial [Oesophagostomum dentatum]
VEKFFRTLSNSVFRNLAEIPKNAVSDWCFASGIAGSALVEKDKDPLLPENRKSANGPSAPYENGEQRGWPWVDPEEPSTML